MEVKTESRVQSSGVSPRPLILGEMNNKDYVRSRKTNLHKSYRSSRNIMEIRRNQISQRKIGNLLNSNKEIDLSERQKLSPERMDDKTRQFQERWSQHPLKILQKLEKEIFLNYDMFEKPEKKDSPTRMGEEPIEKD